MFRFGDPGGAMYGAPTSTSASNTTNLLQVWTAQTGSSGAQGDSQIYVSTGSGRLTGTSALVFNSKNPNRWSYLQKTLDNQATLGIAFAINLPLFPQSSYTPSIIRFMDSGTVQLDLRINSSGSLFISNGNAIPLVAPSGSINTGQWVHIEFLATFATSGGSATVYVNGSQVCIYSGNTATSGTAQASIVTLGLGTVSSTANECGLGTNGSGDSSQFTYFDDIIIYDGQITDANGFTDITGPIGNCYLNWLLPIGAGAATNWTPLTGSNWSEVDDTTVDDDTSYVSSNTIGQDDTYTLAQLPGTLSTIVKSVMAVHCARLDTGSRSIESELYFGGSAIDHATSWPLTSSYVYYFSNWGQNPSGPINWTTASVNSFNSGQKVSA